MRDLIEVFNVRDVQPPEGEVLGWKCVGRDMRTHGGFLWPTRGLVRPGLPKGKKFTTVNPCPRFNGDGLCLAKTMRGAASGGIPLSTVLILSYRPDDVLRENSHKLRVKKARVLDVVDAWKADFSHANLTEADLYRADLFRADLTHANLFRANLSHANLPHANLAYSSLARAYLDMVDAWRADFSHADLTEIELYRADLFRANLTGAKLRGANLAGANLRHANLTGADLTYVNLKGADLTDANLTCANLRGANLRGAIGLEGGDIPARTGVRP